MHLPHAIPHNHSSHTAVLFVGAGRPTSQPKLLVAAVKLWQKLGATGKLLDSGCMLMIDVDQTASSMRLMMYRIFLVTCCQINNFWPPVCFLNKRSLRDDEPTKHLKDHQQSFKGNSTKTLLQELDVLNKECLANISLVFNCSACEHKESTDLSCLRWNSIKPTGSSDGCGHGLL